MINFTVLTPMERSYLDECALLAYNDAAKKAELSAAIEAPCKSIGDVYRISSALYEAMGPIERNCYDKALSSVSALISRPMLERRYTYYRTWLTNLGIADKTR